MGDLIDILEMIADVCVIFLGIIYGIFIITEGGEPSALLLVIGMIAFGVWDFLRVRRKRRRKSIKEDKQVEDRETVDSLIEDLKNGDSGVRLKAATALEDITDIRKIEPLIEALNDKDERVRKKVANALVKTGNRKAIESLVYQSQTDESESVKVHIIFSITEQIKGIKASKYITKGMKSEDERIRDLAYEAFFKKGDKQALETLITSIKDSSIE